MKQRIWTIIKILMISILIILEGMVLAHFSIGNDLINLLHFWKAVLVILLLIFLMIYIDKVMETLYDLGKGIISKNHRIFRVAQLVEEIRSEKIQYKKYLHLFHLVIFQNSWLVIIVFLLHSTEWIVNGISLSHGDVKAIGLYSLYMRLIEYPIVIITLLVSYIKDRKRFKDLLKKAGEDNDK